MDKKMNFSVKIIKKERFLEFEAPISEEKKKEIVSKLEQRYGGKIELIETNVHIYTPMLTRNGEQCHRLSLLKDALNTSFNFIFRHFSNK